MEESAAKVPGRMSRRFRRKHAVLIALIFISLGLACVYAYHSHSSQVRLHEALGETDHLDPNWRMPDLEAHRREVSDAENGMVQAMAALRLLPTPWPNWDRGQVGETAEAEQARHALASSFMDLQPPAQLGDAQVKALRAELKRAGKAVVEARKLIDLPYGIQHVNWTRDFYSTLLPNTQRVRELANLLAYDILLQANDVDFAQALRSARAMLNTARALGDEPSLISQLVRSAVDDLAWSRVERVLAQGIPSPADLLAAQRGVEQEAEEPILYYGMRGERAMVDGFLENVQKGEVSFRELGNFMAISRTMGAGGQGLAVQERLQALRVMLTIRAQRAEALHYMNQLVEAAKLPPEQQLSKLHEMESMNPKKLPLMIRLLGPPGFKLAQKANRIRAQLRCTAVALAAERYRQAGGRWPQTLGELVPEYIAGVPLDPFNGQPLKLGKHDQGIVIYSVGLDGVDNGGAINAQNPGSDLGFRLWNVSHRRQPARPLKRSVED
jgi:hypothetical protein